MYAFKCPWSSVRFSLDQAHCFVLVTDTVILSRLIGSVACYWSNQITKVCFFPYFYLHVTKLFTAHQSQARNNKRQRWSNKRFCKRTNCLTVRSQTGNCLWRQSGPRTHLRSLLREKLERVGNDLFRGSNHAFLYKLVVDVLVDKGSRPCGAHLTLVHEGRLVRVFHGVVHCVKQRDFCSLLCSGMHSRSLQVCFCDRSRAVEID